MKKHIFTDSSYKQERNKIFHVAYDFDILFANNNNETFLNYFIPLIFNHESFRFKTVYGLIIKIKVSSHQYYTYFKGQRHLSVKDLDDLDYLKTVFKDIILRTEHILTQPYPELINEYPEAILIEFFALKEFEDENDYKHFIKNLDQLKKIKSSEAKLIKKDFNLFGGYLKGMAYTGDSSYNVFDNKLIKKLVLNKNTNKLEGFPEDKFKQFDHTVFFKSLNKRVLPTYIKLVKQDLYGVVGYTTEVRGRSFVITIIKTKMVWGEILEKKAFNEYGELISEIIDFFIAQPKLFINEYKKDQNLFSMFYLDDKTLSNPLLLRKSGNISQIYDYNDNLIATYQTIAFKPIGVVNKNLLKDTEYLPDLSFGVMDIETYNNEEDSEAYVYSIGYYIHQEKVENLFYIDKDLDSSKLVHACFDALMNSKYYKRQFYIHNLGGFDAYFIIKSLAEYNIKVLEPSNENLYVFENLNRDDSFLKLTVKRVINGKMKAVVICDSYALLPSSLDNIGKNYGLENKKIDFPYEFVRKNTLFYKGVTPLDYFKKDKDSIILTQDWNLKEETLKYLSIDLKTLHEALRIVGRKFHKLFDQQITKSLTIAGLSMKIFMKDHYDVQNSPLPLIKNKTIFSYIYEGYHGGRTEVFNPYGENLYYYDVNSLYPSECLNTLCGTIGEYVNFVEPINGVKSDMFGFYYCKINTHGSPIKSLGLLPKKTESGDLLYPLGEWYGTYFSEELKFAQEQGYEIEVYNGYSFNKVDNVFSSFINTLNEIKSKTKDKNERNVAKLTMNSNIGRYGMAPFKNTPDLVNSDKLLWILARYKTSNYVKITKDLYYVSYLNVLDKETCIETGLDYIKELNSQKLSESVEKRNSINFESISTAAAVLSYSRIYMLKAMLYVINNGGTIYYTDTDSLVIDIKLPDYLVDPVKLGLFKLETEIAKGYFLAEKTYVLVPKNWDGKESSLVKKAKGILSDRLTLDDYKNMYDKGFLDSGVKKSSSRNLAGGFVVIKTDDNIKLNLAYKKRYKVIVHNKWIDTSPMVVGGSSSRSLIPYINSSLGLIVLPIKEYKIVVLQKFGNVIGSNISKRNSFITDIKKKNSHLYTSKRGFSSLSYNFHSLKTDHSKSVIFVNKGQYQDQHSDEYFSKYNVLSPFKCTSKNLLAPIYITNSLVYSLDKAEDCFSKLCNNNLVKKFIFQMLNTPFINTSNLGSDSRNILNIVRLKEPYVKKKVPILYSDREIGYSTDVSFSEILFNSYESNVFVLNKIYRSLQGRFEKDKIISLEYTKDQDKLFLDKSDYDDSWCGCYVIYDTNSLYFYIGYSKDFKSRFSSHILKLKHSVNKQNESPQHSLNLFEFYIKSCIANSVSFDIEMGPISLYKNYFKEFVKKYPDYRFSVGEYLILNFITDLVGKIMEQSLIFFYNPLLNHLKHVSVNNIVLDDKQFSIPYTSTDKIKKIRYHVNTPGNTIGLSLKTELYLVQSFNLDIKEVLANLGKEHYYNSCWGLSQPLIINRIEI